MSEETTDAAPRAADQAAPDQGDQAPAAASTESTEPVETGEPAESTASDDTASGDSASGDTVTEPAAAGDGTAAPRTPPGRKIVFRIPASSYVAVVFLAVCVSFVAVAAPYYTVVYLIPLGVLVWIMRTRTEVDADRLVVRRVLTRTVIPWSRVASLRLVEKGWIRVVRTDGGEIALPSVRTRHLPALALISGGRLTDPTDPASGADAGP